MIRRYPSLYLLCFVIGGIVIADRWGGSPFLLLILSAAAFGGLLWFRSRSRAVPAAILLGLAFGLLAAFSFSLRYTVCGPNHLKRVITEPSLCHVYGQVADWPDLKPGRTEIVVAVDSLRPGGSDDAPVRAVDGSLLLNVTDTSTALQRGDRIAFYARLYPIEARGGSGYDYGRFLNLKGVFTVAYLPTLLTVQVDQRSGFGYLAVVDKIRSLIRASLDRHLSPTGSALARGFLIGETRDIPPEIYRMFRDSGTLHLLAVSGSNVALVILFFVWVLRPFWFGPTVRGIILLGVVVVFAGLSYGDPSVMRASVMAALVLGARLVKRRYDLNHIIALTALVILLYDPAQLYDVGFQLSFVVAWGLIFFVPRLTVAFAACRDRAWYRWLLLPFIVVLVAQVCSTPIIAYYFHRVPVVSLLANLVVVPLVAVAVLGVLLALVADLVWPLLATFIGGWLNLLLEGIVGVHTLFGGEDIPILHTGSLVTGTAGIWICLVLYLLLVLAGLAVKNKPARRLGLTVLLLAVNVALVAAAVAGSLRSNSFLECHTVPGGVAVLVSNGNPARPELIITGLTRRNYPLDERVLEPLLRERGVERLNGVFLLDADFDVLDDLLRTAGHFEASTVYAPEALAPSLADAATGLADMVIPPFEFFTGRPTELGQPGYHLGDNYASVNLGPHRVDVVARLTSESFALAEIGGPATLVIGSTWSPAAADWIRLRRSGYSRIVCAELEQQTANPWPDSELDPDGTPPDYVLDLSRTGFQVLPLPL